MATVNARTFDRKLVGLSAFRKDLYCAPKEAGACTIVGPSKKGPEWVIVEWSGEPQHRAGDVDAIRLSELDIHRPDKPTKQGARPRQPQ